MKQEHSAQNTIEEGLTILSKQTKKINFSNDLEQSRVITEYLEKNFYSLSMIDGQDNYSINITKGNDNGCDVILKVNDEKWIIDEKAAIHYDQSNPDKSLNTFVLEILGFTNNENANIGWFINNRLSTTHYLFIWPSSKDNMLLYRKNGREFIDYRDNIDSLEVMLVSKGDLVQYLEQEHELTLKSLGEVAEEMRGNGASYKWLADGLVMKHSTQYPESPVNLVVSKDIYKKLAILHEYL